MIRQLRAILGQEHQRRYTVFLIWVTAYGILQGAAVSLLIPIARSLVAGDFSATWTWIGVLAVAVVLCAITQYVQAMRGFSIALTVLQTMHLNIGDHLVKLPLGWFSGRVGSIAQIASKGTLAAGTAAAHLMTPLAVSIAAPATVAVMMMFFDWRLGLVLVAAAPLIWAGSRLASWFFARSWGHTHATEIGTPPCTEWVSLSGVAGSF